MSIETLSPHTRSGQYEHKGNNGHIRRCPRCGMKCSLNRNGFCSVECQVQDSFGEEVYQDE